MTFTLCDFDILCSSVESHEAYFPPESYSCDGDNANESSKGQVAGETRPTPGKGEPR